MDFPSIIRQNKAICQLFITHICDIRSASTVQDGLYFLQIMKWGVLQYCFIRPMYASIYLYFGYENLLPLLRTTLAAIILNYVGLYCTDSWSPGWGHIYVSKCYLHSHPVNSMCAEQQIDYFRRV